MTDVAESSGTQVSALAIDYKNIGIFYNITNTSVNSYMNLTMTYNPALVTNESNVTVWKWNGTWNYLTLSIVNPAANTVWTGNVTSFSVFAPLEWDDQQGNIADLGQIADSALGITEILLGLCLILLPLWIFFFITNAKELYATKVVTMFVITIVIVFLYTILMKQIALAMLA
jgi:hypothetical protein